MRVRAVQPGDIPLTNAWREARKQSAQHEVLLPKTGAVCLNSEGSPLAAAWLYVTNSKLAWLAWPVTRPGIPPRVAQEALTLVIAHLQELARVLGFQAIIAVSASRGLTKLFVQCGLAVTGVPHEMLSMEVK